MVLTWGGKWGNIGGMIQKAPNMPLSSGEIADNLLRQLKEAWCATYEEQRRIVEEVIINERSDAFKRGEWAVLYGENEL